MSERQEPAGIGESQLLTVMIADLRGYTRFTAEHGDEAAAQLTDRFAWDAEAASHAHGGTIVELRGDEVFAVFRSAREAFRAALQLQERVQSARDHGELVLPAGIGVDAGDLVALRGGYRGSALNLAARLCSLAGPGDIFVSEGVVHLARKMDGLDTVDRGSVHLKGLDRPVHVFQLAPAGTLPRDLLHLESVIAEPPNNLPDAATPFIGRERNLEQLTSLLRDPSRRLVTVTGPGGIGKTRLALQVGSMLLHEFPDGVYQIPLATVDNASLVPSAVAEILGLRESGDQSISDQLAGHLRDKQMLLIMDNVEHVIEASDLIADLLNECRELRILASSRSVLRLSREYEYPVAPLDLPPTTGASVAELLNSDAVQLFVDRARAVSGRFELSHANGDAVAGICVRLQGLPLALELAASRIRLFPPKVLLERLTNQLLQLAGGARDVPERQQTLRGAIDWSFNLLTLEEQELLARVSVFAGGCMLEAVEAVAGREAGGSLDVVDGMLSLVEKSLLQRAGEDEPRFEILAMLQEYGCERLQERGELESVRDCHADYFLGLAQIALRNVHGSEQKRWMDQLEAEHDNFRAALRHCIERSDGERALGLVKELWWFWWARGHLSEGRTWTDAALALPLDSEIFSRLGALTGAGTLAWAQGNYVAAQERYTQSLALSQRTNNEAGASMALNNLAILAEQQGEYTEAAALYDEAMSLMRAGGDPWKTALLLGNLGGVLAYTGEYDRSIALLTESLELRRELGDSLGEVHALNTLVFVWLERGSPERAAICQRESLILCRQAGVTEYLAASLEGAAKVSAAFREPQRAARLWGAAAALRRTLGQPLSPVGRQYQERYLAELHTQVDGETVLACWAEGETMPPDEATTYALEWMNESTVTAE